MIRNFYWVQQSLEKTARKIPVSWWRSPLFFGGSPGSKPSIPSSCQASSVSGCFSERSAEDPALASSVPRRKVNWDHFLENQGTMVLGNSQYPYGKIFYYGTFHESEDDSRFPCVDDLSHENLCMYMHICINIYINMCIYIYVLI